MSVVLPARAPLRVLIVHNAYQLRGGEDSVVEAESALLSKFGHAVEVWTRHNDDVKTMSTLSVAAQTIWSGSTWRELVQRVRAFRPDVIHVHNTLPLVSPSVFWAADHLGVPVVQTLHNFRLMCPQATFLREEQVCEDCLGKAFPWPAIRHRCYRNSAMQTAAVAGTVAVHRAIGTWDRKVTRYIALNNFCKSKFVAGGLPADKIDVKPNFVDQDAAPVWEGRRGGLYVGRLSVEKGVQTLMQAMSLFPAHDLKIIGAGPLEDCVKDVAGADWLGPQPLNEVFRHLSKASFLLLPSSCYEGFPRTLVEAFSLGVPVIASRHGSLLELVEEGRTGLLFDPGRSQDLARCIEWAQTHPDEMLAMGRTARRVYEDRYTPAQNVSELLGIYDRARQQYGTARPGAEVDRVH